MSIDDITSENVRSSPQEDEFESINEDIDNTASSYRRRLLTAQILDEEIDVTDLSDYSTLINHQDDFSELIRGHHSTENRSCDRNTDTIHEMDEAIKRIQEWQSRTSDRRYVMDLELLETEHNDEIAQYRDDGMSGEMDKLEQRSLETIGKLEMKIKSLEKLIHFSQGWNESNLSNEVTSPLILSSISLSRIESNQEDRSFEEIHQNIRKYRLETIEEAARTESYALRQSLDAKILAEEVEFEHSASMLVAKLQDFHDDLDALLARDEKLVITSR